MLTGGKVDAVIFGTGTGGTLAGVATYLKEKNHRIHVALADPQVRPTFFLNYRNSVEVNSR